MSFMKRPNDFLFRLLTIVASASLVALTVLVFYGVVMRYVFDDAQDYIEPIALLLVVTITMFGAALKVREGGHIGLDSLVRRLPPKGRTAIKALQHFCLIALSTAILVGCKEMASTTMGDRIPILGLPEGLRYVIPMVASLCIILFSVEHLIGLLARKPE